MTTFLIPGGSRPRSGSDQRLEGGFTILELLVVVAILAVLMAVAVPTFLYARSSTQQHAAQADLRTALEAVNTVYADAQSFTNVTIPDLAAAEPRLGWHDTTTSGPGTLAVYTDAVVAGTQTGAIGLAVQAGDGSCFYAFQADNDAPYYGRAAIGGACNAQDAGKFATQRTL
jgi:type IV pilus assembly protein PilA